MSDKKTTKSTTLQIRIHPETKDLLERMVMSEYLEDSPLPKKSKHPSTFMLEEFIQPYLDLMSEKDINFTMKDIYEYLIDNKDTIQNYIANNQSVVGR